MSLTERLLILIDARVQGAVKGLNDVSSEADKLGRKVGVFDKTADRLNGSLEKVGISAQVSGEALSGIAASGAAAAITGIALGAAKSVQAFQSLAQETAKLQRLTGGTSEEASKLLVVLQQYGIDGQDAAAAFTQFAGVIANDEERLKAYGVTLARTADGNVDLVQSLVAVAEAYNEIGDPARRAALGQLAFGEDDFVKLLPVLTQGADELRRSFDNVRDAQVISDDDIRASEEYRKATQDLSNAFNALAVSAGSELVPQLSESVRLLTRIVDLAADVRSIDLPDVGGLDLGRAARFVFDGTQLGQVVGFTNALSDLVDEGREGTGVFFNLGSAVDGIARQVADAAPKAEALASALERQRQAAAGVAAVARINATEAAVSAEDKLTAAINEQEDAQEALNAARSSAQSRAVAAERAYEGSVRATTTALRSLEDAQERLARLREEMSSGRSELRARADVLRAEEAIQEARSRRGSGDAYFEAIAAADEAEAVANLADAQRELGEIQSGTSSELRDAEDAVRDAQQAYADAAQATRDARDAQAQAAADWADAEREAADKVIKATADVDAARQAAFDADEIRRKSSNATVPNSSAAGTNPPASVSPSFINFNGPGGGQVNVTITNDFSGTDLSPEQVAEAQDRQLRFTLGNRVR